MVFYERIKKTSINLRSYIHPFFDYDVKQIMKLTTGNYRGIIFVDEKFMDIFIWDEIIDHATFLFYLEKNINKINKIPKNIQYEKLYYIIYNLDDSTIIKKPFCFPFVIENIILKTNLSLSQINILNNKLNLSNLFGLFKEK